MFCRKKSHIILITVFILAGFCFGQNSIENVRVKENNSAEIKPHTISLQNKKRIHTTTASDNEKELYLADIEGSIYSFDLETYRQNWSADLGGFTTSNILEIGKYIYVVMSVYEPNSRDLYDRSVVWEIDKTTGITVNKTSLSAANTFYLFKLDNSLLIVDNNSYVKVFKSGLKQKSVEYFAKKELNYQPQFDEKTNELYLIYADEIVRFLIKENEEIIVEKIWASKITATDFAVLGGVIYVGDASGVVYAADKLVADKLWRFRAGGRISNIRVFEDKLLVSSYDNFLYCLKAADGDIIWKKRFPGRVLGILKLSETDLAIKTSYTDELYLLDVLTGSIIDKYDMPESGFVEIAIKTTSRLIIIQHLSSIDIFLKN